MYSSLRQVQLKTGELVEMGLVQAPDLEWAGRIEQLLGHKRDIWNWQNSRVLRSDTDLDACYFLLHRDGVPLANIATFVHDGVGHLAHVWTVPEERRKGAASHLMDALMAQFRAREGKALLLGTGYDGPAYHLYRRHGFESVEDRSEFMACYPGSQPGRGRPGARDPEGELEGMTVSDSQGEFEKPREAELVGRLRRGFERDYFARAATATEPAGWQHWPAATALFLGDFPGAVRCAPLGMFGRRSNEESFLHLIRAEEARQSEGERPRALALVQQVSAAVVGFAAWDWDPLWPETCLLDVYCHPHFWDLAGDLLDGLSLPEAERCVAYADTTCPDKEEALESAGFSRTGWCERRVATDFARTGFADVTAWERAR